jgi:segregation and condensation protein B
MSENNGQDRQEGVATQASAELKAILEALIFASPEPLTPKAMFKLLDSEPKVAGGFQIATRPDLHDWVRRLFHERTTQRLTVQGLETLAVIAYRQPITALEIAEVRGVNTSGVLNTLLERHLVKIVGRKQVVGRPFLYATTKEFLIRFGLNDLADLPKVEDMAEALDLEAPILVERTPPEELLPLEEPEDSAGEDDTNEDGPGGSAGGSIH